MKQFDPPGRFRKCPTYMPRETAQGYLGRLTAFFGARSPKHFCRDYMLDLTGIQHGQKEALQRLAAMTGADPGEMIRCTPRRIDNAFMELNGETLHTRVNPRYQVRMCPLCAKEDIAANPGLPIDQAVHLRCEWAIGVVETCHRHGIRLSTYAAPYRTTEKFDVGYEALNLIEGLDRLPIEKADLDDFERYVLARIGTFDAKPSPLLDPLPLVTVTQLCAAAGADVLRRRGQDATDNVARRRAGFEMLGNGAAKLEQVFVELRQGLYLSEMTSRIIPRLLEYLHEAEQFGRDLDAFMEVLVDICFRNMPYAEGQVLLGRPCPKRCLHDFPSAMAAYGIGRHHLHAFVLGTPGLAVHRTERRQDSIIRVDVADRLFTGRTPFGTAGELCKILGRKAHSAAADLAHLVDAGLIAAEDGASTHSIPPIYSIPDFKAALGRFNARFAPLDSDCPRAASLSSMMPIYGIRLHDVWQLLASDKIASMGRVEGGGFVSGMLLDQREVLSAITGVEDPRTLKEVAQRLGTSVAIVRTLALNKKLRADCPAGPIKSKLTHVFKNEDVEEFAPDYVYAGQARKLLEGKPSVLELKGMGLAPAIDLAPEFNGRGRVVFYRRSELRTFLDRNVAAAA